MLKTLAFTVLMTLGVENAWANGNLCSCEDQSGCTSVIGIPVVFATRDEVRKKMRDLGAKATREEASTEEEFVAPTAAAYAKVRAFFPFDGRLAELQFVYSSKGYRDYLATMDAEAIAGQIMNKELKNDRVTYIMADGAQIVFTNQSKEKQELHVSYVSPVASAELDAQFRQEEAHMSALNAGQPITRAEPEGLIAKDAADEIIAGSLPQGTLEFHGDKTLLGKANLKAQFCGQGDDLRFGWKAGRAELQRDGGEPILDGDYAVRVEHQEGDSVLIKLGVSEESSSNIYRFTKVHPGVTTAAAADGDCRRHALRVTYIPTNLSTCLNVKQTKQESRAVLEHLIKATGITVDGADLIPEKNRTVTFRMMIGTKALLDLLADVSDLDLVEIDPTHFAFRRLPHKDPAAH